MSRSDARSRKLRRRSSRVVPASIAAVGAARCRHPRPRSQRSPGWSTAPGPTQVTGGARTVVERADLGLDQAVVVTGVVLSLILGLVMLDRRAQARGVPQRRRSPAAHRRRTSPRSTTSSPPGPWPGSRRPRPTPSTASTGSRRRRPVAGCTSTSPPTSEQARRDPRPRPVRESPQRLAAAGVSPAPQGHRDRPYEGRSDAPDRRPGSTGPGSPSWACCCCSPVWPGAPHRHRSAGARRRAPSAWALDPARPD